MIAKCKDCGQEHNVGKRVGWKLGAGLASFTACRAANAPPLVQVLGGLIGLGIGHYVDREILPSCPECGGVLRLIDASL